MSAVRAVFFDCDGTLIDTVPFVVESKIYAMTKMNYEIPPMEELISSIGIPLEQDIAQYFQGEDAKRYEEHYHDFQSQHVGTQLGVFVEAYWLLVELWKRGIPLGVVTSRRRTSTLGLLDMFHLRPFFSVMVNPGDTARSKPFGDPLLEALRRLNETGMIDEPITPEECVYIGDAHHDVGCAKDAGMRAILVDWTRMPAEVLEGLPIDGMLHTHGQLLEDLSL